MSYSFHLLPPRADGDLRARAQREKINDPFAKIDPKKEAMKERIAAALVARFPTLEISRVGYGARAPSTLRCFELNDMSAESFGIQIELFDDEASVTVPFWHTGAKAEACFKQIWDVMGIICREAGYAVFDPQMDRALTDGENIRAPLATYLQAMARVASDPAYVGWKPAKPWWRFW